MAIAAFVLGIISFIISMFALLLNAIILLNSVSQPTEDKGEVDDDEISQEYISGASDGRSYFMHLLQLSVFNMFKDAEIYDYETTLEQLNRYLTKLETDPSATIALGHELRQYLTENGANNDDIY